MPRKRTKQPSPATVNDSEYGRFLTTLSLFGLGLKSSSALLDRTIYWSINSAKQKEPTRKFNETYRISRIAEDFFESEGVFELIMSESGHVGLRVECIFEAHIH